MAVAPIVVELLLRGAPAISQGMRNVADTVAKTEKQMQRDAERAANERKKIATQEAKDKVAAWKRVDAETKRIHDQAVRDTERAAKATERIIDRQAREKVRIERQAATEVERIQDRARRNAQRAIEAESRERERAAAKWVRDEEAAARKVHAGHERMARAFVGAAGRGVSAGLQRVGGFASQTAGIAAQLGGGFTLAGAVQGTANLQRSAALLANSAIGVNGVTAKDADPSKIVARARAASVTTGIDAQDLVEATRSYVAKSSDFSGGMANMEFFGQLSKSTGTDINDVTKAMGLIRSQNKDLDAEGAKSMLRAVVMQGKQGSVELEDLAKSAGKITRSATSYSGDQSVTQQKLLGLSQIAVRTAGSTDSAAIALSSLGSDTRNHADAISRTLGYKVLDAHGAITKAPEELLADLMGATGGNLKALGQHGGLGFTKPTMKIFEALQPEFKRAETEYLKAHPNDAKGAKAAGAQASLKEMQAITGQTLDQHGIDDMFKRMMDQPAEQFESSMRQLRQTVGEELLPEFVKLIPAIRDVTPAIVTILREGVPAFADLIKSVADFVRENRGLISDLAAHPIGTLIAFEMTKSFAEAGLSSLLTRLFTSAFDRLRVPVPGGGGGGGAPGAPPAGGADGVAGAAALAVGAGLQVNNIHENYTDLKDAKYDRGFMDTAGGVLSKAGRYGAYLTMPFAAYGMDKAMAAVGEDPRERERKLLGAKDVIDASAVQKATTKAVSDGVREGVRQGTANSGPAGPARTHSVLER